MYFWDKYTFLLAYTHIMDLNKVQINRNWTDGQGNKQEQAEFHNVVLWAKLAEIASQYLAKGRKCYIEGRLQTRSWEAQDGSKRYRTEIVGENMIMLDGNGNKTRGRNLCWGFTVLRKTFKNTSPNMERYFLVKIL